MTPKNPGNITYEKLKRFLIALGFDLPASMNNSQAFHHPPSGTLIMITLPQDGKTVRPADLLSVMIRLENQGLVDDAALRQLKRGQLPLAN